MANIPGASSITPAVVTNIETQTTGVSVPGGVRIASIIGLGARSEVIVASGIGGGQDGLNDTYTSANGSDGRHFTLDFFPIVSNRTTLFLNGIPLVGTEINITPTTTFPDNFNYAVDIETGHILMQAAYVVDQGGSFYTAGATNVGIGTIQMTPSSSAGNGPNLIDQNAPQEVWTIKCIQVQRNNLNQPIAGTASFVAFGSVSGNLLDGYGNPAIWIANNTLENNTILSFTIQETVVNSTVVSPFREGDYFTVDVDSGVLAANASLTATYIAEQDINNPVFYSNIKDIVTNFGATSLDNTLTLGCQLAFANSTPGIMCVEAAPSLPRRTSYQLETNFPATSTNCDDFILPFPPGVTPDFNSTINIFVTNPATSVETQLLANKVPFYTYTLANTEVQAGPICSFIFDDVEAPLGNSFAYTVAQSVETISFAQDGYLDTAGLGRTYAYFSSATLGEFDLTDVGLNLVTFDTVNGANTGVFPIVAVNDGVATIYANGTPPFPAFVNDAAAHFQVINPVFGTVVPGSVGVDGAMVAQSDPSTATLTSGTINFNSLGGAGLVGYQLQITSSTTSSNLGLYDITGYNATGRGTLTIAKAFVSEHNIKFEVQNPNLTSDYLVLNHNIVPQGYTVRVTIVDERDASFFDAGWELALASLETQQIDILVPLPQQTISVIFQNALSHCETMSNLINMKERELFIGAINGLTPANLTGAQLAAVESLGPLEGIQGNTEAEILAGDTEDLLNYSVSNAYGDTYRCVYFYPDQIVVQVGSANQIVDGFYLAAAAAGYLSGVSNVSIPLTNKVLSGFTILQNRQFNQLTYQQLAAAGVTALTPVAGGGNVVWGITTSQSGFVEEQEVSIIFIRDRIAKYLRAGFAGFIGMPGTGDVQSNLMARAFALFDSFISQQLITAFQNLVVAQDAVEPRQWNITASVSPIYPLNWVYIKVGVGVLT